MSKEHKPMGFWQLKTNCRQAACKCKSKSEMQRRFGAAYISSIKHGWLDEFFPNTPTKCGKKFWTKETCQEEAKKYKNISEFSKKCNRAYRVSLDNGWLEEFGFTKPINYTKEECIEIAKTCKNRNAFSNLNPRAYNIAYKNGWIIEIFGEPGQSTKNRCRDTAAKYNSPYQMSKKAPSVYKLCVKNGWLGEFFPDSNAKDCKVCWTYETCKDEAGKYKNKREFRLKNYPAYAKSREHHWLDEFFPKEMKKTKAKKTWTKEECAEIASQCKTRNEFCAKKASAFIFSKQQGWLDEFFGIKNQMTKERCRKSAEYYKTPAKMKRFAPVVYKTCVLNDWLEEFFPKMVKKEPDPKQKTIRSMILDYVAANGSQTKKDLYRVMLTIAGQNINRKAWGVCYLDNVSYGTSVFLPARSDKRYLKQVRGFDPKEIRYDLATAAGEKE